MTTPDGSGDVLGAALIQISGHAERLAVLDEREAAHHDEVAARLRDIAVEVTALTAKVGDADGKLSRHSVILASLKGFDTQIAALASQVADLAAASGEDDQDGYQPVPSPRWWKLTGPEREAALDRLRAWVEQIYKPSYGQLAAMLPACWEQHPLCLHTLDWLSEIWSLLYLGNQRDSRTLAAQAEWHTRLLPAAADQMAYETTACQHGRTTARWQPSPNHEGQASPRMTTGAAGYSRPQRTRSHHRGIRPRDE